ncbi:1,4-alpha-glucan branching protein GlgB [Cellulosilyticum ruminicola]|uniref:1,4-alpha-glucan branching protein GlgB n=1 Tax=Cellulosilyticum ruminicola TaxID=425254 RepID=UPI0006D0B3DF|nr:1,4-alpha-glucan branching protein GlgB [Cellulosilyticum ruminicola]
MENSYEMVNKKIALLELGELNKPHEILGLHTAREGAGKIIRVFCPTVSYMVAVDLKNSDRKFEMHAVGDKGLFEGYIGEVESDFLYSLTCRDFNGHEWTYVDPYQFKPTITSDDLYLFGEGRDYEIHHKLGAHFVTINGVQGVRFAVWAPHAKRVSVIGQFNNWDGRRHSMYCMESHGIWQLFIPGLQEFDLYKYEIRTAKGEILYKADPYANYCEVRPGQASCLYNVDNFKWEDSKWMKKRSERAHYKEPISIYEVHIGSWKKHFDDTFYNYREVAESLVEYVKDMGYTHVELMGIIEHPFDGSWGYQVTGYFAPTSRYGTPEDFKYLIELLHKNNIGVILDWVPAHFPKDAFALEKFDGEALYESSDECKAHHPHWGTLIFDYSKPQVVLFLIASAMSWLETYHIDGLRVDAVASMLYLDYGRQDSFVPNIYGGKENLEAIEFLKHLNSMIYRKFEGAMMIAEESTAWPKVSYSTDEGGLGFGFKWNMGWMNDFLSYMRTEPKWRRDHHSQVTFSLMYAFSENFIQVLSHDEVVHGKSPMLYKMPGPIEEKFANLRTTYGFMYMHPGKKMLFMGDEFAQTKEWNEKVELDWGLLNYPAHEGIRQYVKALNHLYTTHNALWETGNGYENFEWIDCENYEQSILSFVRNGEKTEDKLVVVVNFMTENWECYRIGVPEKAEYREILNSDSCEFGGEGRLNEGKLIAEDKPWHGKAQSIEVNIPPLSVLVFEIKKLATKSSEEKKTTTRKKTITKKADAEIIDAVAEVKEATAKETKTTKAKKTTTKKVAERKASRKKEVAADTDNKEEVKVAAKKTTTRKKTTTTKEKVAKTKTTRAKKAEVTTEA